MISGQAANRPATRNDCPDVRRLRDDRSRSPRTVKPSATGASIPTSLKTLPDQLSAVGQDLAGLHGGHGKRSEPGIGDVRPTPLSSMCSITRRPRRRRLALCRWAIKYAARHNPFVYFHSIIDSPPQCDADVVSLNQLLPGDLESEWATPNLVFITPTPL